MNKKKRNNRTSFSAPQQKRFGDNVNHPKHYNSHPSGVECIDIVRHYNFNVGNVIKYLWRHGLKHEQGVSDRQKAIEDLRKAQFYLNDEIERLEHEAVGNDTDDYVNEIANATFFISDFSKMGRNIRALFNSEDNLHHKERSVKVMPFCENETPKPIGVVDVTFCGDIPQPIMNNIKDFLTSILVNEKGKITWRSRQKK